MGLGYCSSQRATAKSSIILVPSLDGDNDKWCWKCQQYKDKSQFYSDAGRPSGIKDECKQCDNKARAERFRKAKKAELNRTQYPNKPDYLGVYVRENKENFTHR